MTSANQRQIILHSILAGLTPLIPIPFLDDLVKTYFKRRMVRKLAASHSQMLRDADVEILADDKDSGCLAGCLSTVLLYPLKAIFRKIFFFLEWKRAIDTVSHTYYQGFLIDFALSEKWLAPIGSIAAVDARRVSDVLLQQVNTSLIERAVTGVFKQSKATVKKAANLLQNGLRRLTRRPSQAEVAEAIEPVEAAEEKELEGIVGQLQSAIERLPREHFDQLRDQFAAAFGFYRSDERR